MDAALVQPSVRDEALGILSRLGAPQSAFAREGGVALSPITGEIIARVRTASSEEVSVVIGRALRRLRLGARSRRLGAGSLCGFSRRNCVLPRTTSAGS